MIALHYRLNRWAVGLSTAAVAVRVYSAWCFRHNLNLDAGVVALMARHIAAAREFPVFFYGQAHMGSLEALLSGLFCAIGGVSGFAISLGTAVTSMILIPVVYLWAKAAGGPVAGTSALAFIIIGPGGFFHYNGSPRGAYAAALSFGALVIFQSTRMAIRWSIDREQRHLDYLWLGLAAGLAWWSSQLTTASILAAGILLLLALRTAVLTWRLGSGLIGFLAGSAPFWIYNLRNEWASFAFTDTFGQVRFRDALGWFFTSRFAGLMLPAIDRPILRGIVLAIYIAFFLIALGLLMQSSWHCWRRKSIPSEAISEDNHAASTAWTLMGIVIFTLLFAASYASSHFAQLDTPRYFLPMVAPIAVLIGMGTACLHRLPRARYAAFAPLLLLIAMQTRSLVWGLDFSRQESDQQIQLNQIAEHLSQHHVEAAYAPIRLRAWNAALDERFAFSDLLGDFHASITRRAELADVIAIIDNYSDPRAFLKHGGGSSTRDVVAGFPIEIPSAPSTNTCHVLDPKHWESVYDDRGLDHLQILTDGRIHTAWTVPDPLSPSSLTIQLHEPATLSGIRMTALGRMEFPFNWEVKGLTAAGDWLTLYTGQPATGYFWSGPRMYWGTPYERLKVYFPATTLRAITITHMPSRRDNLTKIFSIDLLESCDAPQADMPTYTPQLLNALSDIGIERLYADRWVANQIIQTTNPIVRVTGRPELFPQQTLADPHSVRLTSTTGLLVEATEAHALRQRLYERKIVAQETTIGPWHLFHEWDADTPPRPGLHWAGYTAYLNDLEWALAHLEQARQKREKDVFDPRIPPLLETAIDIHPLLEQAAHELWSLYKERGDNANAQPARETWEKRTTPDVSAAIDFSPGISLIGYSIEPTLIHPGSDLKVTYFWHVSPTTALREYGVFIHFIRDTILFQDDHSFLEDVSPALLEFLPSPTIITSKRTITVPSDIPPGDIEINVGLLRHRHNTRIKPTTDLPERRRAVLLPSVLTVPASL